MTMDNGSNRQGANQPAQGQVVPYSGPGVGGEIGSGSLFQVLWKGWWLVLVFSALGVGGAFAYLEKLAPTPLYRSAARLLVEKPPVQPGETPGVFEIGAASRNFQQTQASLIMSAKILDIALGDPNLLALRGASDPNCMAELVGGLYAEVEPGTDVIAVSACSRYAEDTARFVNAVVRAYVRWTERNRALSAMDALKDLNNQLADYRSELERKRQDLRRLQERQDAAMGSSAAASDELDTLKQNLLTARTAAKAYRAYYEGLLGYKQDPNRFRLYALANQPQGFVVDDRQRVRLEGELLNIQSQLEAIGAGAIIERSVLTQLAERKAELEAELKAFDKHFVSSHLSLAEKQTQDKVNEVERLAQLYKEEGAKLLKNNIAAGEYSDLVSECRILESLCTSHVQKIAELKIQMPQGLKIHVLEKAQPGLTPPVQKARILGIGLVAGIMLGSGLALIRDWRDQRIRSAQEITTILGVPVLGAIPKIRRRRPFVRRSGVGFSSNSRESEACRAIRTALIFGTPEDQATTLLITSPSPREGKTTLVSNLAVAMARAGQKTLIIDADLRKPMQQRMFAMKDSGKGLTDLLSGTAELDDAIRKSRVKGLDIIASGTTVDNPSEMLNSQAFSFVLEQLTKRYDRIIIDSPPVGAVTDGQILAARCDLTLIVLRANQSTRQVTLRARDALYTVGARVAGAIVNDVSKKDRQYSHYSGYGYYYGSHSERRKTVRSELPAKATPDSQKGAGATTGERLGNKFHQG